MVLWNKNCRDLPKSATIPSMVEQPKKKQLAPNNGPAWPEVNCLMRGDLESEKGSRGKPATEPPEIE